MTQQTDVWVLKLTDYFMKQYGYQLVTLTQEVSSTWLINEKNNEVPVIMITAQSVNQINAFEVKQVENTLSMLMKSTKPALTITVNDQGFDSGKGYVLVTPGYVSNPVILTYFPNIQAQVQPVQNVERSKRTFLTSIQNSLKKTQRRAMLKNNKGSLIIAGVAVVVFVVTFALVLSGVSQATASIMMGAYYKPFIVWGREVWRFITPAFVHYNITHIFFNILALRSVGKILEPRLKTWKFLAVFFAGVVMGNIFVFLRDESVIGVGMSGGIYALLGTLIIVMFETGMYKNPAIRNQMLSTIFLNLIISALPNVSFTAHLGGLFVGIFLGFIFSFRKDWASLRKGMTYLLGLVTVTLCMLMIMQQKYFEPNIVDLDVVKTWYDFGFKGYASRLRELVLVRH